MEKNNTEKTTRREALARAGKTAVFIAPVIITVKVKEVMAGISRLPAIPPPPFK